MVIKLIISVSIIIATATTNEMPEGQRLIKLNPNEPAKWMAAEEVSQLDRDSGTRNFMDLTDAGEIKLTINGPRFEYIYRNRPLQQTVVRKLFPHIRRNRLKEIVSKLSSFKNRDTRTSSGPNEAEGWLETEIRSSLAGYSGGSGFIDKIGSSHGIYNQDSLLARVGGHDPNMKEEIIILSAHYDARAGRYGRARSPAADDNASGCAVLLEVLRLIAQFGIKFKHSVELHWYTANEFNVLPIGSEHVVTKYRDEKKAKVKGVLNLDSIGFPSPSFGKAIGVLDSFEWDLVPMSSPALTAFVKMLIGAYVQREYKVMGIDCERSDWCISDHFSWHQKGYPWAFVTEVELTPHRNSEEDTVETLDFEQANEFAKLALAFVIELGELSKIPEIPDITTLKSASAQWQVECAEVEICCLIMLMASSFINAALASL